jgi:hypothetical protein
MLAPIRIMSGRVNVSKFLFAVCVFGLFLSSAFAEEKSPEQYREERSRIFGIEGLESQTFTRVVASGAKQRIAFYTALNPDCTATGDVNVRVTKQPEHGTVEITTATNFPGYPKESSRYKCNQHKVKGMHVNYKAAEKYTGNDEFDLLILLPTGFAWEHHFDVSVR